MQPISNMVDPNDDGYGDPSGPSSSSSSVSSMHQITRGEALRGLSNRFIFSQFYIYLYLAMAGLSLTTVVLSLLSDCPTFTFYMLEIIVNTAMIAEVSIRLVAFGKNFWKSYYNTLDLAVTILCGITILVIFFSGCSAKGEEVFDTFLLVVRNLFQFGRLALVMRKSGKNIFTRPSPIDLSSARQYAHTLDLDEYEDEEALLTERRALGGDLEAATRSRTGTGGATSPASGYRSPRRGGAGGIGGGVGLGGATNHNKVEAERPFLLDPDDDD